jgi:4-hydroxy-tetrahydrodipicolinate synthase
VSKSKAYVPHGVIPATLLALNDDGSIDFNSTRKHLRDVAAVKGLSAITVNGHASEVHACSVDEQRKILVASVDEIGDRLPIISGVYADGSAEAARVARMADEAGASALLVFPPNSIGMGGYLRPEMAKAHFHSIAAATDLPLILFQYPERSGVQYPFETLLQLVEAIPSIRAIKDWCGDPVQHETHIRALQTLPQPVNVLSTHSAWLMSSLVLGCNGLLSGAGSVIADLQVGLWRAIQSNDLAAARALNDRIHPMTSAFYAPPFVDMHNRMKECLVLLGRLPRAVVRPPLMKLPAVEIDRLRTAIRRAGLAEEGALDLVA